MLKYPISAVGRTLASPSPFAFTRNVGICVGFSRRATGGLLLYRSPLGLTGPSAGSSSPDTTKGSGGNAGDAETGQPREAERQFSSKP